MALKDLKSDLSWYGKKPRTNVIADNDAKGFVPNKEKELLKSDFTGIKDLSYTHTGKSGLGALKQGYVPNTDSTDTKFSNTNGIPGVSITGYSDKGNVVGFRQVTAGNSFNINPLDSSLGLATRTTQLGAGSPFLKDIGWHTTSRYSDAVKKLDMRDNSAILTSGIAFRYTANSPIDDQYNKFKVRDESWNPIGYAREPFILRGIQRDGKTKNQRYGVNFDDGLIRGGVLTSATRIALDAARLGKWLIKPKGIMWMTKQLGMQMTNPNTESALGTVAPPFANTKKIFTPINLLANVVGAPLGLRFQRHGIIPLPTTSRYEEVTGTLRPTTSAKKENNRLNKLLNELQPSTVGGALPAVAGVLSKLQKLANKLGFAGQGIKTLSGATGPGSVYGLGSTQIRRVVDTSFRAQMAGRDKGLDGFGLGTKNDFWFHDNETQYFASPLTTDTEDEVRANAKDSLKQKYNALGIKSSKPYFGAPADSGPIWTTLKFVTPFIISSLDQEKEINNSFTGDPFNLRNTYEASKFALTGINSQLVLSSIVKQSILSYTLNNTTPYYSSGEKITTVYEENQLRPNGGTKLINKWNTAKLEGFGKTGLEAQVNNQGGVIPGYGSKDVIEGRLNTIEDGYYNDNQSIRTSLEKPQEGSTPDEREDNLRKDKTRGKNLKSAVNYWSKGSEEANIGAGRANTLTQTAAGNNVKPIQHYAAMAYGNLQTAAAARNEGRSKFVDFREPILQNNAAAKNFIGQVTDEKGAPSTYERQNREAKYNEAAVGTSGRDRSNRLQNNVPDPINASPFNVDSSNPDPNLKDFINFKFYPIGMGKTLKSATDPIQFRAFIDSLSDAITPSWGENNDQGRADAKIMLEGWARTIDLTFKVAAFSGAELQSLYNKMEALALCAYPDYTGTAGFTGRYVKIHIGDLYKNEPCYITNISFDWDNETPWELDEGLQVPYYTTVTLSLGWIGSMRPDATKTKVFSVKSPNAGSKFGTAQGSLTTPNTYNIVR
mgnify:FL=1